MSKENKVEVVTSNLESTSNDDLDKRAELQRGLKPRHIQLIAIGGVIGTGLFVGSGAALSTCGPAALLTSYLIMSVVIYGVMLYLAEMATYLPLKGSSISTFATRYVDKSLGFAMGWNYWYSYNMLVPTEITAAGIVVKYWTDKVPVGVWITIFWLVIVGLNCLAVKYYGEAEFWFASLKIFCILGLIVTGIVIFFGGAPTHDRLGFRYWNEPGSFAQHLASGNTAKFLDVWTSIIKSAFAFIQGPELVALAAGEAKKPRQNIPFAARTFVYRVIFFYVLGALVIGVIVPYTNPNLLSGSGNGASSPFVIGIKNAGIKVLDHIVNAVILTSAWSSGNSYLYASTRSLLGLAREGYAPKFLDKTNKYGVPITIIPCAAFSLLAYLNVSNSSAEAFNWFSNICTISGLIGWVCLGISYLRFRKACSVQGIYETLPYKAPFQPYLTWFVIVFVTIVCITNGYAVFFDFNGSDFVAAYITLPLFFGLYFGHKIYMKVVHGYTRWYYPAEEIDLITGLAEVEAEDAAEPERIPKNFAEKVWFWMG
ncbi:hypothetical protein CANTEDRAFT_113642 [Yamadazyma tenuis ATCC 10573]|uniref:Amino acid permease/ SLC12A domain-containing protein n=1 Tax=Candida tenuis (strain ATCC 10573 / BCRC 21748 / CBS 615 / JCM 9827 / NBRC 10315 / NRRL Y-1498 / VKM Y-70) TaxID=590646 RepID=G3B154_CANTC|nr:uncharacterized protein CANTEDRAFT_113642 [Yamadazyma tenuis ATCC 10573]EGV65165.1 hypothetical protein CANTEDRAFT_113642 [Yamadazyma tenuis ATCC 10573]